MKLFSSFKVGLVIKLRIWTKNSFLCFKSSIKQAENIKLMLEIQNIIACLLIA